jgi:hypothetical protein
MTSTASLFAQAVNRFVPGFCASVHILLSKPLGKPRGFSWRHFNLRVKWLHSNNTVQMNTPFFPAFRARLSAVGARVQPLRQQSLLHLDQLFSPLLPPGILSQADEGPNSRERIYTVRRTFFGFLYQVLNPGCPGREVVHQIQALFALQGGRGVDNGTSTSLPDTAKNQRAYPQPGTQKPGCGFPLLKLVGVFSLATGALLDYAKGNQHQHELNLLQKLLDHFKAGDLALANRGFNSYIAFHIDIGT